MQLKLRAVAMATQPAVFSTGPISSKNFLNWNHNRLPILAQRSREMGILQLFLAPSLQLFYLADFHKNSNAVFSLKRVLPNKRDRVFHTLEKCCGLEDLASPLRNSETIRDSVELRILYRVDALVPLFNIVGSCFCEQCSRHWN